MNIFPINNYEFARILFVNKCAHPVFVKQFLCRLLYLFGCHAVNLLGDGIWIFSFPEVQEMLSEIKCKAFAVV